MWPVKFNKLRTVYTITGKTDGFGAQYLAIMSGIAICKYKNYDYLHTPIKKLEHNENVDDMNKFIGIKNIKNTDNTKNNKNNRVVLIKNEICFEVMFSQNPSIYYRQDVIDVIKNFYYSNSKPIIEDIDIAIHIRRGDVYKNSKMGPLLVRETKGWRGNIDRFIDDKFYIDIIDKLLIKYPTYIIHIYSEGKVEDFSIKEDSRIKFHLNENLVTTYHSFVRAKVLVMARSCLSYSAGILNENEVYYMDFWHKKLDHWINIKDLN